MRITLLIGDDVFKHLNLVTILSHHGWFLLYKIRLGLLGYNYRFIELLWLLVPVILLYLSRVWLLRLDKILFGLRLLHNALKLI